MPTKTTEDSIETMENIKTSEISEAELKRNTKEDVTKQMRFIEDIRSQGRQN